ncbi:P-loop containing nucleoside triphosphate hydrolase protein [Epithele typhae]|uniref:P-loop containing nucleoside triphosphate hydrolase protein n=1 Tax=Epithele typhae TaxID=378194 RepID=UPI00200809EE|nr:P-loop containing nucleoside triphosphate hydrolase protein [Epithele typhae]KAH9945935.1 P-loop containing nucleoside triphosphate hydrolase protein [Epithele typhae]
MPELPLLQLKDVAWCKTKGQPTFTNVHLTLNEGEVLILQGKSGCGKSTLLKCISHLNVYEGEVLYRGQTPQSYGVPYFRTQVAYVPQRASLLSGSPRDFLTAVSSFAAQHAVCPTAALDLADTWGVPRELWDRPWASLSGGEAQRVVLAIAVGACSAEVLLLDEPTSALDGESTTAIEKHLVSAVRDPEAKLKAVIWVTHSPEQGQRVGTRFLRVTAGGVQEVHPDSGV